MNAIKVVKDQFEILNADGVRLNNHMWNIWDEENGIRLAEFASKKSAQKYANQPMFVAQMRDLLVR